MEKVQEAVLVRDLKKSFFDKQSGEIQVFDRISLSVEAGMIAGFFGPSGCGKTTLLRILCGVLEYESGDVFLFGNSLVSQRGIVAYVPQHNELLSWKSLWRNALLGWEIKQPRNPRDSNIIKRGQALFRRFNLEAVQNRRPQRCSGGQRQRAAIVRALLTPARILALDEPVSAIDHITRTQIYETLLGVVEESNLAERLTVLVVSHDPEELLMLCDCIFVMPHPPVKDIISVKVPFLHPRATGLRFGPEFVELKKKLWGMLS